MNENIDANTQYRLLDDVPAGVTALYASRERHRDDQGSQKVEDHGYVLVRDENYCDDWRWYCTGAKVLFGSRNTYGPYFPMTHPDTTEKPTGPWVVKKVDGAPGTRAEWIVHLPTAATCPGNGSGRILYTHKGPDGQTKFFTSVISAQAVAEELNKETADVAEKLADEPLSLPAAPKWTVSKDDHPVHREAPYVVMFGDHPFTDEGMPKWFAEYAEAERVATILNGGAPWKAKASKQRGSWYISRLTPNRSKYRNREYFESETHSGPDGRVIWFDSQAQAELVAAGLNGQNLLDPTLVDAVGKLLREGYDDQKTVEEVSEQVVRLVTEHNTRTATEED